MKRRALFSRLAALFVGTKAAQAVPEPTYEGIWTWKELAEGKYKGHVFPKTNLERWEPYTQPVDYSFKTNIEQWVENTKDIVAEAWEERE